MEYLYCEDGNFEDFASGRVLYGGKGIPNFPVRLLSEIYQRAGKYLEQKEKRRIYDPCCGGGAALTTLGILFNHEIEEIWGSDIDPQMVETALKNTGLLSRSGLEKRRKELKELHERYGKISHLDALQSLERFEKKILSEIRVSIRQADCTKELPPLNPDLIITDVPYGNLVEWENGSHLSVDDMLEQLHRISHEKTILAVCMDKKQKIRSKKWERLEKANIGKRRFEILKKSDLQSSGSGESRCQ